MIRAYVVEHDVGFAPNPFYGVCTLAACKPRIRGSADIRDWIVGIGSVNDGTRGKLVYAMKVDEKLTFDEYWLDQRFQQKHPNFCGSLKQAQGDNAYHRDRRGNWIQERCRHTHSRLHMTQRHIDRDTSENSVLISWTFVYFGQEAIDIPHHLVNAEGAHLSLDGTGTEKGGLQREKNFDDPRLEENFVSWLQEMNLWGYRGDPVEWTKADEIATMLKQETFPDE